MKKNILFLILLIVLNFTLIFSLLKIRNQYSNSKEKILRQQLEKSRMLTYFTNTLLLTQDKRELLDKYLDTKYRGSDIVTIFIPQNSCSSCILTIYDEITTSGIGNNSILILMEGENKFIENSIQSIGIKNIYIDNNVFHFLKTRDYLIRIKSKRSIYYIEYDISLFGLLNKIIQKDKTER